MARPKVESTRYRFSVPIQDASVQDWIDAQSDLGMSLRMLIKGDIIQNGFTDVTCRDVVQMPRRGRPPVMETAARPESGRRDEGKDVPVENTSRKKPVKGSESGSKREGVTEPAEHKTQPQAAERPVQGHVKQQTEVRPNEQAAEGSTETGDIIAQMLSGGKGPAASAAAAGLLD